MQSWSPLPIYQLQQIMKSISTSLGLLSGFAIVIIVAVASPVPSERACSPDDDFSGLFHYSLLQQMNMLTAK